MLINNQQDEVNGVIRIINAQKGTSYRLLGAFEKGEWKAYRIAETGKQPVVLKYLTDLKNTNIVDADPQISKNITDRLFSLGYPVPKYIFAGRIGNGLYWIQEELPGEPLWEDPTVAQVKKILTLLELQKNQAVSDKQDWTKLVKETIFHDRNKHLRLLNSSKEISKFINDSLLLVQDFKELLLPTSDIVHGDFSYHNVMVKNNEITGIIDWQEAGCGDWLIDLTRLIYSLHDRPNLVAPLIKKLSSQDLPRIKLYTVFTALEMLSWPKKLSKTFIDKAFNKAKSAVDYVFFSS